MFTFTQANSSTGPSGTQFMDRFNKMPGNVQRVIIGLIFLALLVGIMILKDMIATEEETRLDEDSL